MLERKELIDCYLLVELVNIVSDLVLGLHVNWVLLYSMSCGHIAGKRWWLVIERRRLKKGLKCADDTCLFHQRYVSKLPPRPSPRYIHTSWTTTNSSRFLIHFCFIII